jgi:hypothetical protein
VIDPALLGLLGVVAGVLAGGVTTAITDALRSGRETRLRDRDHLRSKMEELCETAEKLAQVYRNTRASVGEVVRQEVQQADVEPAPWAHLTMLVNFYAPELKPKLDLLEAQREPFGRAMVRMLYAEEIPSIKPEEARKAFDAATVELIKLSENLQAEAAAYFRRRFAM